MPKPSGANRHNLDEDTRKKLRRFDRKARDSGLDDDRRQYLKAVIKVAYRTLPEDCLSEGQTSEALERVYWTVSLIVDATETGQRGVVWRHKAAVTLAVLKGKKAVGFDNFLKKRGGYKGCAEDLAMLRRKLKSKR